MKHYFYWIPFLVPILFIFANIYLINSIDKKLIQGKISIQSQNMNSRYQNIKIRFSGGRRGSRISFVDTNGISYERRYTGTIFPIYAKKYYMNLQNSGVSDLNIYYINKNIHIKENRKQKTAFFNSGRENKKSYFYYLDILNYIKDKYMFLILLTAILTLAGLMLIGENQTNPLYFGFVFMNIILFILYFLM